MRTGTALERPKVPLKKWAYAIYLSVTSLKGVSSMKLHRDIGVTQKTAWFMAHRIREAWGLNDDAPPFTGPVEVDETYMGGKEKNRHVPLEDWRPETGKEATDAAAFPSSAAELASAEMYSPISLGSALFSLNSSHSVSRGKARSSWRSPSRY